MLSMVTVRCGHCTNLLSVNLRALMHSVPEQDQLQQENIRVHGTLREHHQCGGGHHLELGSSSSSRFRLPMMMSYAPQNEHLLQEQTLNNARRKFRFLFCLLYIITCNHACISRCVRFDF
ncbi:Putative axial regulator YABBY 2 [Zea mays]|uniref:Putative axial regulator YABBY 2 n=1 Tax=Zea mays TaxID=4577 RepID=A0A1D6KGJ2_MAIZE|nr:Putative axial regulator YABBY 2 [Zea mays]